MYTACITWPGLQLEWKQHLQFSVVLDFVLDHSWLQSSCVAFYTEELNISLANHHQGKFSKIEFLIQSNSHQSRDVLISLKLNFLICPEANAWARTRQEKIRQERENQSIPWVTWILLYMEKIENHKSLLNIFEFFFRHEKYAQSLSKPHCVDHV